MLSPSSDPDGRGALMQYPLVCVIPCVSVASVCILEHNHAADGFPLAHQVESLVDLVEPELVRDEVVDGYLAFHVPVDDLRHVAPAFRAPERRALPHAPRHELERARLDLLPRARDADDDRDAPSL